MSEQEMKLTEKKTKEKKVKEKKVREKGVKEKKERVKKPHPKLEKAKKLFKRFNTKRMQVVAIIVLVIIALFIVKGILTKRAEKMSAFNVTATYETVTTGDISITVAGDGNLSSGTSMIFSAVCDLAIDQIEADAGSVVAAGDVIATLDEDGMQDILNSLAYALYEKQVSVDESSNVESTYYIKAPATGRLKDIQVEEEDDVKDVMDEVGYLAIISTVDEMKIEVTEAEYETLSAQTSLVIRTEDHKYTDDITLRMIDGKYYVILPTAMRTIGAEASVYSASATKVGNELATGVLELVDYVYVQDTYGEISYQDDFENYWVDKGEVLFHVDQYKYSLDQAYDELEEARAQYDAAVELAESLVLVAPYDGIIGELNISNNSTVSADSTVAVMYSAADWTASVSIDELDINSIELGQSAVVTIDALDYGEFDATVVNISNSGSASGGITTYDVVLAVDDNDLFKLAMTVTCEIEVESAENAMLISSDSLRTTGTVDYVLVKADRTVAEKAEIRKAILSNDMTVLSKYISISSDDSSATNDESMPQTSGSVDMESMPQPSGDVDMDSMPQPSGGFDMESMPKPSGGMDMAQGGNAFGASSISLSNPVELLYGDIVIVEAGLDDGTNVEIISGLSVGDEVLIPITTDDEEESSGFSFNLFGGGTTGTNSGGNSGGGQMPAGGGGDMPAGGGPGGGF